MNGAHGNVKMPSAFAVFEETKIKMYRCRNPCRMIGEIQLSIGRSGRI